MLGDSGSFQHLKQSGNLSSNQIQFYPKGGFFVMDHLVVGLVPPIEMSIVDKDNRTAVVPSTYTLSVGPFLRYYYPLSSSISSLWATCPKAGVNITLTNNLESLSKKYDETLSINIQTRHLNRKP